MINSNCDFAKERGYMEKIVAKDTVKILSFPKNPERMEIAMRSISGLTKELRSHYEIDWSITFENIHNRYPVFSEFLMRLYGTCAKHRIFLGTDGTFSPFALMILCHNITKDPLYDARYFLRVHAQGKEELLQPFMDEARSYSDEWPSALGIQLHMLSDKTFVLPAGGHGITHQDEQIALVIMQYPEIIYHEFLHLFGVGEGYDEKHKPKSGCEKCWMQYEVYFGTGLCQKHQDELRDFLKRMKGKEIERQ